MSIANRLRAFRYVAALVPAVALLVVALLVSRQSFHQVRVERVTDHAQLVAANVDLTMRRLLDLTTFCTSAPALLERVDLQSVRENCGRYATQIGGWLVIVETGETHRQILNTLTDASAELPVYPRSDELPTLRALEARSRSSGEAGIAEVFTGIIRQEGIVSAGQHVRLADGRDAMLYVSVRARSLSDQLAELAEPQGLVLGLIDASKRVVARSDGIDRMMFAPAPEWLHGDMEARRPGVALEMRGPQTVNGLWDVGYQPLEVAPGWMAVAVQPSQVGLQLWAPLSLPSAVTLAGFLVSALLYWGILRGDQAARRIEAARRAELEAKRQDQDKSRLLASFAHDIRSPLISLIGSLEMIGYGRNAAAADVRAALRAAESLLQLVDDILELSFLGSGEMSLHPSPVDVGQVAAGLCEQNRSIADRKGIVLQLDLDEELPPVVELDRLRLQQVLSNLMSNALKYTRSGSVTLRVKIEEEVSGQATLDIAVIDTGIGLAPEEIPKVLREYGRLDREVEQSEAGTGLGLAIVQRILLAMGTELRVESSPGLGSTFHFRLKVPVSNAAAPYDALRPLSGAVILYAEDEPVIRQVTTRRLEEAGAQVVAVVDGHDALRRLSMVSPDLLLIDLQMPALDGIELIQELEKTSPDRAYPIFVLTSHISGPQAAEARVAGADAIFTKPVQVAALAAALRARRRTMEPLILSASPADKQGPILDLETFHEATGSRDRVYATELVARFEKSLNDDRAAFAERISAGDLREASRVAHRCMGLCQVMGARALADNLLLIEQEAAAGHVGKVRVVASDCDELAEATLAQMRAALAKRQCEAPVLAPS